ncbi:PaaI family thioesterase [Demequina capsici]|uniref:PaaI family thioesterase n=1 Tax=Demequina capsici TaxID=3075620 RepID=A0AA96F955_9MICO|nr:PaaI family thioesterase [Demequina sp. PMTSA13]WNM26043.1 PaaI family thioesterase [Demequina sp. PMTSA13]
MTDIDGDLTRVIPGSLMERLGITLLEVGADKVVGTMPVLGNTQPVGLLHGGATAALAETLGSYGAAVHAGPGRTAVGIDLSITHHRAVRDGHVTATAIPLHLGGRVCSYTIEVVDDKGIRVASARLTCVLVPDSQNSE